MPKKIGKKKLKKIVFFLSALILTLAPLSLISYSGTIAFEKAVYTEELNVSFPTSIESAYTLDQVYSEIEKRRQEVVAAQQASTTNIATTNWAAYPDEIIPVTKDPNNLLVLVNKKYQLPSSYSPSDLSPLESTGLRLTKSGLYLRSILISDLTQLATDINSEGIDLSVLSAYRSYVTQQITYNFWVTYNGGSIAAADMISARPGHSQHQLGTAIDFSTSQINDQIGQHFANTSAGVWLSQNAWKYGFALAYPQGYEATTGYSYEPWHFRYIGKEKASTWHSSGQILEIWLRGQ